MDGWLSSVLSNEFSQNTLDKNYKIYRQSSDLHNLFNSQQVEQYLISHEGELHKYVMIYDKAGDHHVHANPTYFPKSQVDTIRTRFRDGASLKIDQFERRQPEISIICRQLEAFFGGTTFAKIFWTPANKRGLTAHFDAASVFVIQLEGEKKWFLWDSAEHNPTQQMARVLEEESMGPPAHELLLRSGDVLYIPAGTPHRAECTSVPSLHVSVGLIAFKTVDLLRFAVDQFAHMDVSFRQSIVPGITNDSVVQAQLDACIESLKTIVTSKLVQSYARAVNASRPNIDDRAMYSSSHRASLNELSKVKRVQSQLATIEIDGDALKIYLPSVIVPEKPLLSGTPSYLELPAVAEREVEALLSGEEFGISNIPGPLDVESKMGLVDHLIQFGLLEISEL